MRSLASAWTDILPIFPRSSGSRTDHVCRHLPRLSSNFSTATRAKMASSSRIHASVFRIQTFGFKKHCSDSLEALQGSDACACACLEGVPRSCARTSRWECAPKCRSPRLCSAALQGALRASDYLSPCDSGMASRLVVRGCDLTFFEEEKPSPLFDADSISMHFVSPKRQIPEGPGAITPHNQ